MTALEAPNAAQALGQIIASQLPFDAWYQEQLLNLHGVNLAGCEHFAQLSPLSPNQEVYFEWLLIAGEG